MLVASRGAPPSVARFSATGVHASGIAHGSSIENSALGTSSTAISIAGIIRCSGRGITHAMPSRPEMMVDLELDDLKREFLAEADEKVRGLQGRRDGGRWRGAC